VDRDLVQLAINLGAPLFLLVLGYFTGSAFEHSHYRSIRLREHRWRRMPTLSFPRPLPQWRVQDAALVTGSVVISLDYFKRFLAGLRGLVGGHVKSYEALLDRARREAVLRMQESAQAAGFHAVVNLRLDTSRLASSGRNGKGTAGVEILAFGTALKLADPARL